MSKLVVAASLSSFLFGLFGVSWDEIDEKILAEYPTVKMISVEQLLTGIQRVDQPQAQVFDVREPDEFAVSHLEQARNLATAADIAAVIQDKDTPIVVYCSVGYRSAGVAADLQDMGYTDVRNLQHSLFEWANKRYPMVNATGTTDNVHPFNRTWGRLVDRPLRSYVP